MLKCEDLLCSNYKRSSIRKIEYIIVHYQGCLASAASIAKYYKKTTSKVSAHYVIDDKHLYRCVQDKHIAWHCATSSVKHPLCTNINSIGIDVIANKLNKSSCKAEDNDWYLTTETWNNATSLIAELCNKYNIPITHVVRHNDVTGKLCPRQFCTDIINQYTGNSGNKDWELFKQDIKNKLKPELQKQK